MKVFLLLVLISIAASKVTIYQTCIRDIQGSTQYMGMLCDESTLGDRIVCVNTHKNYVCTGLPYQWSG